MANGKKSFTAYCDWQETFKSLPDDKAGQLIKHLFAYVNDENPHTDDLLINAVFAQIKATLKRDLKKWEKTCETNKASALLRWNKKNANASERIQSVTFYADSDSDSDSDKEKNKDIEVRKREFYNSLTPFISQFGKDTINEFFGYWSEHGEKDKKFRKEKEKSFSINRRLETWKKNESKFSGNKNEKPDPFKNLTF